MSAWCHSAAHYLASGLAGCILVLAWFCLYHERSKCLGMEVRAMGKVSGVEDLTLQKSEGAQMITASTGLEIPV